MIEQLPDAAGPSPTVAQSEAPAAEKRKRKGDKPDRGVDTLFRVTYMSHVQLSQQADTKAGMLFSINGLIVSVLIALLTGRATELTPMFAPVVVLMLGAVVSLALAVSVARPRIVCRPPTLEQVSANEGNLLFFSHFAALDRDTFQQGMRIVMQDRDLLYGNLIRDLHQMGIVLTVKYLRLQLAYSTFQFTIVAAVLLFLLMLPFGGVLS